MPCREAGIRITHTQALNRRLTAQGRVQFSSRDVPKSNRAITARRDNLPLIPSEHQVSHNICVTLETLVQSLDPTRRDLE